MKTLKLLAVLLLISVCGFSQTHTFCPLDAPCTWTAAQASKIGTPDQAKNGLNTRVPTNIDIEDGSAASPTTSKYQTKPNLYVSDYGATVGDGPCILGMAAPCLSALSMFEGTNQSTTTSADLTGVIVNLWGAKASTQSATWGNQWIGGAFQLQDSTTTPNIVSMTGLNPNMIGNSIPAGCAQGAPGSVTCARTMNGFEADITNATATDGVFEQTVGNRFQGASLQCLSTNATPSDCTYGLSIATGTTGHGFKIGQVIGGAVTVGSLIPQAGISGGPSVAGIHVASGGATGITIGTGSTTYSHGISQTLTNPVIGLLFDAKRLEGNTSAVQSNTLQFRSATGAATYLNWAQYLDTNGTYHWQTDKAGGGLVDAITYAPNATAINSLYKSVGNVAATGQLWAKFDGTNYFALTGTPTAPARTWTLQDTSDTFVGRGTTDTFTGVKTFTAAPVISSITNTGTLTLPTATGTLADVIASGTSTFTTTAVGAGACQTTVTTAATGALTTDTISWAYASAPTAATDGVLHIQPYVTANNVNFMRCNASAGSITPTALVINWRVIR